MHKQIRDRARAGRVDRASAYEQTGTLSNIRAKHMTRFWYEKHDTPHLAFLFTMHADLFELIISWSLNSNLESLFNFVLQSALRLLSRYSASRLSMCAKLKLIFSALKQSFHAYKLLAFINILMPSLWWSQGLLTWQLSSDAWQRSHCSSWQHHRRSARDRIH